MALPPPRHVNEHMVYLRKVAGEKVGLALRALESFRGGSCLRIVKVDENGLIADWNQQNPDQQVRNGDRILEVNGIRGNSLAMVDACRGCSSLSLMVRCTSDLEERHLMMQYRQLGPEDFELLRLLDEAVPARTNISRSFVAKLPRVRAGRCGADGCSICLQSWDEEDEVTQLPCRHHFCTRCVEQWLTDCRGHCPICNAAVLCSSQRETTQDATPTPAHEDTTGTDIGMELQEEECRRVLLTPILTSKIVSATRCQGLGCRTSGL